MCLLYILIEAVRSRHSKISDILNVFSESDTNYSATSAFMIIKLLDPHAHRLLILVIQ